MNQLLKLTCGTETIHLTGPEVGLKLHYFPLAPVGDEPVTESVEVHFANRTILNEVNRYFELARRYQNLAIGNRVFIEFKPDSGDAEFYRSEITDGKTELSQEGSGQVLIGTGIEGIIIWTRKPFWEGALTQIPLTNDVGTDNTSGLAVCNPGKIIYEDNTISFDQPSHEIRRAGGTGMNIFKTGEYVGVCNTTDNNGVFQIATGNLNGKIIVNPVFHDTVTEAAGHLVTLLGAPRNTVDINGHDVAGDLPSPPVIEMKCKVQSVSGGWSNKPVFIAHNIFSDVTLFDHILTSKDASGGGSKGAIAWTHEDGDQLFMYGSRGECVWNVTTEISLCTWTLTKAQTNALKNNYFRLLLNMPYMPGSGYTDLWFKIRVYGATMVVYESPWVLYGGDEMSTPGFPSYPTLFELGTAQLPMSLEGADDISEISIQIDVKKASAGPNTVYVDYLQLSPMDGWRKLSFGSAGLGWELNEKLIDDMVNNWVYVDDSGIVDGKIADVYTGSSPILLLPDHDQRLYFLVKNERSWAFKEIETYIKVWHRPRRSTI